MTTIKVEPSEPEFLDSAHPPNDTSFIKEEIKDPKPEQEPDEFSHSFIKEEIKDPKPEPEPEEFSHVHIAKQRRGQPVSFNNVLPPYCEAKKCNRRSQLCTNKDGRPYYICPSCPSKRNKDRWITWADAQGVHPQNRTCNCGYHSRLDRHSSTSWADKNFYCCAIRKCKFWLPASWKPAPPGLISRKSTRDTPGRRRFLNGRPGK